jgi:hypothetical protein
LSALALSALTALTALTALSGLLLLLAWLLLAAAALLLARLVLAALLLAGVLLVRIVHNVSYFGFSPVMTTIVTPLGCSRSELNSERTKFREGAQADTRENPAVVLQKKNRAEARRHSLRSCHRSAARSSTSSTSTANRSEIAEMVGIAEAGVRCHGGRY